MGTEMRLFVLDRATDVSGVSGTGTVAEGVVFSDGSCAMRWRGDVSSTVIYRSIADLETIHGHGGATRVVFV